MWRRIDPLLSDRALTNEPYLTNDNSLLIWEKYTSMTYFVNQNNVSSMMSSNVISDNLENVHFICCMKEGQYMMIVLCTNVWKREIFPHCSEVIIYILHWEIYRALKWEYVSSNALQSCLPVRVFLHSRSNVISNCIYYHLQYSISFNKGEWAFILYSIEREHNCYACL